MDIVIQRKGRKIGKREKISKRESKRESKTVKKLQNEIKELKNEIMFQKSEVKRMYEANEELFQDMVKNEIFHSQEMKKLEERSTFCTFFDCKARYEELKESFIRVSEEKYDLSRKNGLLEDENHHLMLENDDNLIRIEKLKDEILNWERKYDLISAALTNN